jgi:hypothetical protein
MLEDKIVFPFVGFGSKFHYNVMLTDAPGALIKNIKKIK